MPNSKNLRTIKNISLLGDLSALSLKMQKAKNLMEASESVYTCASNIIPADLFMIHQKLKGEDSNLIFIRTLNDSTITGSLMKQEQEIALRLMKENQPNHKTVLSSTPPLHYSGTVCTVGGHSCCLSLLRISEEFSEQEQELSLVILQIFFQQY